MISIRVAKDQNCHNRSMENKYFKERMNWLYQERGVPAVRYIPSSPVFRDETGGDAASIRAKEWRWFFIWLHISIASFRNRLDEVGAQSNFELSLS